eukprot:CAMPEP_0114553830 /NCGR_PEP_ID=MMETSP0114-20121206/7877_1 /TAXON_ID=31324 /ORGANISM="Goniomonas sp, Strain m" /LENGTH=236 /DNA_ID=CAMNT_0001738819 /DNA_START=22 /DNA_END=732 /DNA_ORIENTATION=-
MNGWQARSVSSSGMVAGEWDNLSDFVPRHSPAASADSEADTIELDDFGFCSSIPETSLVSTSSVTSFPGSMDASTTGKRKSSPMANPPSKRVSPQQPPAPVQTPPQNSRPTAHGKPRLIQTYVPEAEPEPQPEATRAILVQARSTTGHEPVVFAVSPVGSYAMPATSMAKSMVLTPQKYAPAKSSSGFPEVSASLSPFVDEVTCNDSAAENPFHFLQSFLDGGDPVENDIFIDSEL